MMTKSKTVPGRPQRMMSTPNPAPPQDPPPGDPESTVRLAAEPTSPLSVGVLVLATLAVVGALYLGKEVVLPIVLALLLKLMLQPIMSVLCDKFRAPPSLAAVFLIICLFLVVAGVALTISVPASAWIQRIPEILPELQQKLEGLRQPIAYLQQAFGAIEKLVTSAGQEPAVTVKDGSGVAGALALGTVTVLTRFFATMVVLFFLLACGDRLLRGLIEVLPRFSDKRQAVAIATEIQRNIGGYLLTITVMNAAVGVATGLGAWASGLGDPILWGSTAFLLNYVPILGPLVGIGIFLVAGVVSLDGWAALLPAGLYLTIHIVEGETVTPMLLASQFRLNPVLVIVSLFFWHAIWGIPGALLAVPLLAMFKIVCDHVEALKPVAHIIAT
jgi:predicted PurR-regulated permease PerM